MARPSAATPDGEKLVSDALAHQASLASYVTLRKLTEIAPGVGIFEEKARLREPDGAVLERLEVFTRRQDARSAPHVRITNRTGTWDLNGAVAIREPDAMRSSGTELVETALDYREKTRGERPEWRVEPAGAQSGSSIHIVESYSPGQIAALDAIVTRRIDETRSSLPVELASKPDLKDGYVPARCEYVVDPRINFVVGYTVWSVGGARIVRRQFVAVKINPALPQEFFTVPPGLQLLFPQTAADYVAL